MQVTRTGNAERMSSQEVGVPGAWRQVTGKMRAGSPLPLSLVQSAIFLVICPAFIKLLTSDKENLSLTHLVGCHLRIGFRYL